jgi:site-specific DNA-methyltransferase (adenine-specific)
METLEAGSVDLILTDPPYGTTACKWDNVIPFEPMWGQIWRVLKPNGACVLFGSEPFSSKLRMSQLAYFKYDWVWEKDKPNNFAQANYMPMKYHEMVSVFSKGKTTFNKQMQKREGSGSKRCGYVVDNSKQKSEHITCTEPPKFFDPDWKNPSSVQKFSTGRRQNLVHPTQKPVALLEYLIRTYTIEGETVLDFTMGSGSTGVACVNTGRKFIGIELDGKYFEIARERIARQHDCLACKQETLW